MEARAGGPGDPTRGEAARGAQAAAPSRVLPITSDPAPLGLAGFALTTFILSLFNAELLDKPGEPIVLGLAVAYGGTAQLLAGMWEFRTGNTFGATAFTSYGAFWISFFVFNAFFATKLEKAVGGDMAKVEDFVGWFLIGWGIFTTYMWIASFRVSIAVNVVLLLLAATYLILGFGNVYNDSDVVKIGGYVGIATAAAAWYTSFALVFNYTFAREILPVRELRRA
jgi:uncharacterized protein